jgi:hypothetical protein
MMECYDAEMWKGDEGKKKRDIVELTEQMR